MTDTNAELLPCPFCGGEASQFAAYITCKKCGAELQTAYAIDTPEKWNTRAALPQKRVSLDKLYQAGLSAYAHAYERLRLPDDCVFECVKSVLDALEVDYVD